MTSFNAINIEPESDSEDEIDDSKEIQIEEALKLYQNALKLHAQGPAYYYDAEAAYATLFQSEIFAYPEAISESKRIDLHYNSEPEADDLTAPLEIPLEAPLVGNDGAPSTLPQILYLAYKNHGQFLLDQYKAEVCRTKKVRVKSESQAIPEAKSVRGVASTSLGLFVEALDRDDTDLELWRRASRVSDVLGSRRVARYCLESVLDTDGDESAELPDTLGFEEAIARQELKDQLRAIQDPLSESQLAEISTNYHHISKSIMRSMDTCPFLPSTTQMTKKRVNSDLLGISPRRHQLKVPLRTWASCGKTILHQLNMETQGLFDPGPGAGYSIFLPETQGPTASQMPLRARSLTSTRANTEADRDANSDMVILGATAHAIEPNTCTPENVVTLGEAISTPTDQVNLNGNSSVDANMQGTLDEDRVPADIPAIEDSEIRQDANDATVPSHTICAAGRSSCKRSTDSAGFQEAADTRSKRMRTRGSLAGPERGSNITEDSAQLHAGQLLAKTYADHAIFEFIGIIYTKLGISGIGTLSKLKGAIVREKVDDTTEEALDNSDLVVNDFFQCLSTWNADKIFLFLLAGDPAQPSSTTSSGLAVFLEHSKRGSSNLAPVPVLSGDEGLESFIGTANESWTYLDELALIWIKDLLFPKLSEDGSSKKMDTAYEHYMWPDILKETVVQILVKEDGHIFSHLSYLAESPDDRLVSLDILSKGIQNIFELHLDIYGSITNPSSVVDSETRIVQLDRVRRWSILANTMMRRRSSAQTNPELDDLAVRHMWSIVVHISLTSENCRDHILLCLYDLKEILSASGGSPIELPNNVVMPEVSIDAADREISRLMTMDFFINILDTENAESLMIIHSLEPILERTHQRNRLRHFVERDATQEDLGQEFNSSNTAIHCQEVDIMSQEDLNPQMQQILDFVDHASLSLQLLLRRRLQDAYAEIGYRTKVFSCHLQKIELIAAQFLKAAYLERPEAERQRDLVRLLRIVEDEIANALDIVLNNDTAFEIIDEKHLLESMTALAHLQRILHVFTLWEDSGQLQEPPQLSGSDTTRFKHSREKFRTMQVKLWMLQYTLLRESTKQLPLVFEAPIEDLADYLKLIHYSFGLRHYCKAGHGFFLRFLLDELMRLNATGSWELDIAQVIRDLYGLKIGNFAYLQDHGCTPVKLDRRAAISIMDLVITQVNRTSMKDLLKSELKGTIDFMQRIIGVMKPLEIKAVENTMFNRRLVNAYQKSAINPLDMYRSLRGIGELSGVPVVSEYAEVARKGWYFLLGNMALARFRSTKRNVSGPTPDLDQAQNFLRQDLDYRQDHWETWYRLAQCYDARIEEDTTWSADKINNQNNQSDQASELRLLQRNAIHCYSMAVSTALRCAEASFETASKISDMYADFGMRMYASSREPFSMDAFRLADFERPFSSERAGMYNRPPFRPLQLHQAWKFARVLFEKALAHKPQVWMSSYMLGKCLWKLYNCSDDLRRNINPISHHAVLDAFTQAVEKLPAKRDSRHPDKEPILEPHYKLLSIVHKLVQSKRLQLDEAYHILQATPYARKIPPVHETDEWEGYVLQVLKTLKSADKANWHHRMVARVAHIIYDDSPNDLHVAAGAKHELCQTIFTKTMTIQVWRPEFERAGRHFVYTNLYTRFFIRLLAQLQDRASLEALAKRIRRRPTEFLYHTKVWEELCKAYLSLLRFQGRICPDLEDAVFKPITYDQFQIDADRLDTWAHLPSTQSTLLDLLREAMELKKLNGNLMKYVIIEDLIGDIYATIYQNILPELIAKSNEEENRDRMRVNHLLMNPDTTATGTPPPQGLLICTDMPTTKSRAKVVTKREIQRKAEALVARPIPPKGQALAPRPPPLPTLPTYETAVEGIEVGDSAPGSLHDSADDESDLSDIEEVPGHVTKPMFPNLAARNANGEDTMDDIPDSLDADAEIEPAAETDGAGEPDL